MDQSHHVAYEFNGFRLDPVCRTLAHVDGRPVHLKAKAFDTLLYLVEHAHELVSKETLLKAIWPHVVVEENSLAQAISELRHAFGERPEEHRYIVTVWGRGYRFVADVRRVEQESGPVTTQPLRSHEVQPATGAEGRWDRILGTSISRALMLVVGILAAVVLLLATVMYFRLADAPAAKAIAVLPFEYLGDSADAERFASALHDDVLTQLAKLRTLKVISRTSVMQYEAGDRDLPRIARDLNVGSVLEGTVHRTDGRMHVNVRLVDANTGELLWSESFDQQETVQNIVANRADIIRAIANTLGVTPSTEEMALVTRLPTQSSEAYQFYLSGRQYARGADLLRDLPAAVQQFEQALAEDPGFALAAAHLAIESIHMYWTMDRTDSRRASARAAVERALELEPNLPEAHLARAWYLYQGHLDYVPALEELAIAEQGMPGDADLLFAKGAIYRRMGKFEEAVEAWNKSIDLDPRNTNLLRQHATTYTVMRDYAAADALLARVVEIAPDAVEARTAKAELRSLAYGDDSAYLQAVTGNPMLRPDEETLARWWVAMRSRQFDEALQIAHSWDHEIVQNFRSAYDLKSAILGETYVLAGRPEDATAYYDVARQHLEGLLAQHAQEPRYLLAMSKVLVGLGQRDAGVELALGTLQLMPKSREAIDGSVYQIQAILCVLAPAEEVNLALEQLDDYLSAPGFWSIEGLLPDPRLDKLRADPRFAALVEKYKR